MDGWYTDTKGVSVSSFLRNKDDIQWKGERWRAFYQDEWERNERVNTVQSKPYAFWDYSVGLGSADTTKLKWVVFYRNRWDQLPGMNSQELSTATLAEQWGVEWAVQWNAQTRIMGMLSQRNLMIKDSERFQGNPEKTLLGKVGLSWRDAKGTWSLNTYYQVGSGLEQRKSFVYIEVPLGQGNFVWIDYNDDGIKDLNEFEIPAFGYEANYIRSQVPSSDFVAVGTTQATGSLQWHPQGAVLKNWSNAFNVQSESKRQGSTSYSWSMLDSRDSSVVQSLFLLRDQFQWNAANPHWGASIAGQWNQTKSGLTMGFEWREEKFISPQMRIGGDGPFSVMPSFKRGWKEVASDFLISRNYQMVYDSWWLQMQWKPAKEWLINLQPEWIRKKTRSHGDVSIARCAVRSQYQNAQRQNWFAEFGYHQIGYSGNDQGSVYYDLLEGLQTGENFTWSLQWQTMTGKLQWSAIYNGRAAQDQRIIHTGTIQVKAVF
jgi:hypothetical protein